MQPNDQQGYYRPEAGQPAPQPVQAQPIPVTPPQPQQAQPAAPVAIPQPAPIAAPAVMSPTPVQVSAVETVETADVEDEQQDDAPISWVAHEYIHQEKGVLWFVLFALIILGFLATSIFLMKSWSFAALLAVIAVVVVVYSRRPPRELTYSLTDEGLTVDGKLHKFGNFKSFGVVRDGQEFSVMLIPVQRFQPSVTVYFPEEVGEEIVDILGSRLPMKDLKLDMVDHVVRLLRL
jgi:hypothetical protein